MQEPSLKDGRMSDGDMEKTIRNIVWDMDGTLMDTLQDLMLAVNHALKKYDMPERTMEQIRCSVGNGVRRLVVQSVPGGEDNPLYQAVFDEFRNWYLAHCEDHTAPYEGILEVLRELKMRGYRMAIVSNKIQEGIDELHRRWFSDTIDVAIGERPGIARKPAADMVRLALREIGASQDDSVYIGDSDVDMATARNSGLPCISVLWGFRTRRELSASGAKHFVGKPHEILEMLDINSAKGVQTEAGNGS